MCRGHPAGVRDRPESDRSRSHARDAALARLKRATRVVLFGATALAGAFAGLAAHSAPGHHKTAARTVTRTIRTTTQAATTDDAPATTSAAPAPPPPPPVVTQAPPVVASGGS
jgi:type IV secretory pathway VirB10-like protein